MEAVPVKMERIPMTFARSLRVRVVMALAGFLRVPVNVGTRYFMRPRND